MSRIIISNLNFSYKEYYQPIFQNVNLSVDTNWKLGLIGRNGRGKSTFLKLIHGDLEPDQGTIVKDVKTEYFPYSTQTSYKKTIDVIKELIGKLKSMEERMEVLVEMTRECEMQEYQEILEVYLELDGYSMESKIKKELNLMNLSEELLEQEFDLLSGGEKTKMQIIALFLRKNAFVLLDEPTNHLDLEGKRVIAEYLQSKKGFLVVSHDRGFIDRVVDHILSINKADIAIEKGNYTSWKLNKDQREAFELRSKERLEREVEALEKVSVRTRSWASLAEREKNPFATNNRGNSSRAAKFMRQAKTAEQTIQENINEKKNLLKNYEVTSELKLSRLESAQTCLVAAYGLSFGYSDSDRLLFEQLSFRINQGDRIWIRGKNGSGKSTLLSIIDRKIYSNKLHYAENLQIERASQEPQWSEGWIQQLIPDAEIRGRFLDICHHLDLEYDTLQRPIETFSSGELKKIDIARALAVPSQLLLLDEPLNFMDVYFREQLEKAILTYRPTLAFVEHDELFGSKVATGEILL
jgi:lincosamide and streptogramin A transport system ATP-binding/permease protein